MPLPSFDPSQILNPFVTDDDDESEADTDTSDDDNSTGDHNIETFDLDTPTFTIEQRGSDDDDEYSDPTGSFSEWHDSVVRSNHHHSANSIETTHNATVELSTEAYEDLREHLEERHETTFRSHLERLHAETSPRQDTLSDEI